MIFGYMRVSTRDKQTTDRQKLTLEKYSEANGFEFDELFEEKLSGKIKAQDRTEYAKLKKKMRCGDILVISDLDRLGRNADDVIIEMKDLKARGVKVVALDMPFISEWNRVNDDSMFAMIIDIVITLKAHMAQQEREKTVARINQGLAAARAKGQKLGRPQAQLPEDFVKKYEKFRNGEYGNLSATAFAKTLNIGRATYYKYIHIYNERL